MSFHSPSARHHGERHIAGFTFPPDCALRFSQPLDALLPPRSSRFVSPWSRSRGLCPSEVSPRLPPDTFRLAVPLLTFECATSAMRRNADFSTAPRLQGFERLADPFAFRHR
jgi:hypothetical protein